MHYHQQHACLPVLGNSSKVQNDGNVTVSTASSVQCQATISITNDDLPKPTASPNAGPNHADVQV